MNKEEFLKDLITTYEECDSECGECLLANYITIFDTEYLLCDVIQSAYQAGILNFCKINKIDLNKAEKPDK